MENGAGRVWLGGKARVRGAEVGGKSVEGKSERKTGEKEEIKSRSKRRRAEAINNKN